MASDDDGTYDFAPGQAPPPKPASPMPAAAPSSATPSRSRVGASPAPAAASAPRRTVAPPQPAESQKTLHECPFCGFSFAGSPRARCPECASALDSGTADYLQFAPPAWVRRLAAGSFILALGIVTHVVGVAFRIEQVMTSSDSAMHAKGIFHAAGAMLIACGVVLITLRPPGTARGSAVAAFTAQVSALAAAACWLWLGGAALGFYSLERGPLKYGTCLVIAFQVPLIVILGARLAHLALRIPDDRLASHARVFGWLIAAVSVAMIVLWSAELVMRDSVAFFPISFPIMTIMGGIIGWGALTLVRLGLTFRLVAAAGTEITERRRLALTKRNSIVAAQRPR